MSRQFRSDDTDKWLWGFGSGSAGNVSINTSTDAPIDSACSGTAGSTSLSATNASFASGQLVLIHQTRGTGAGSWELNKISSYVAGTITLVHPLQNTYTTSGASAAQVLVMTEYNNLTINSGQTLTAKAWNGTVGGIIAKFVKGTCTVQGTINGTGKGFRGGVGGSATSFTQAQCGEGTSGAQTIKQSANGNGGGGNYSTINWTGGGGGGGGNGTTGTAGTQGVGGSNETPGAAGTTSGSADLTTCVFGGGGGGGGGDSLVNDGRGYGGTGGSGGGFIFIIAKKIIINGTISNSGTNGETGTTIEGPYPHHGASGAGAGGSILIKTQEATLGTNKVISVGGTGGVRAFDGGNGGNGGVGRIHLDYKTSYTGSTNPTLNVRQDATLDYPPSSNFFQFF